MNTDTEQLLPKAFSLHQAGNIVEAESLYRVILKEDGDNPLVLSMLGMLCLQRGEWEEGIQLLNTSLAIEPNQPDTLSNLGYALQNLRRYDEAVENYDRAIALFPDHVSAYFNRGNALQYLGRYEDAAASFRKALILRPNHANTCVNLGNVLTKLGRHDEALSNYIKALNLKPGDAGIANNLGLSLKALGRYKEALNYFSTAISAQPGYADAHFNRALTLQQMGRSEEALAGSEKVIALQPEHAEAHSLRGQILQNMERYEEALASYQTALAINPEHVGTLTHLGVLQMEQGRSAEAIESFTQALEVDPECAVACHNLAMLGHYAKDPQACEKMQSLYGRRDNLAYDDQIYLGFAMGKAMEDAGRYDEAFAAYEEGNRLCHQQHPVDEEGAGKFLEDSISFFTADLIGRCRDIADRLATADDKRTPIFIVGMPRSGTTLIEQILSAHPQVFGAGELKVFDEVTQGLQLPVHNAPEWDAAVAHLSRLGQSYQDKVWQYAPKATYITDKLPGNFMHLGLIHMMLPRAKIIHAMRDPMDSCFSCYTHRFRETHDYAYDLGSLGRYYQRYAKLMRHWHQVLPQGSILDVGYESVVADPEREVRRLLEYLGLPWDEACLRFYDNQRTVKTASLNQVRRPIYSSSVARWKHFENHLKPLIEIVRTVA